MSYEIVAGMITIVGFILTISKPIVKLTQQITELNVNVKNFSGELKEYKENNEYEVGLVGKGVTFDSGGLSLKPNSGMLDMKQDMTGSSVVVATMKSIALQKIEK